MNDPALDEDASTDGGALGDSQAVGFHIPDETHIEMLRRFAASINIADEDGLDEEQLSAIGQRVKREYDIDWNSLAEWREKNEKAEKIANQVTEQKQYPWPQASSILYPLITIASIQFAARAYPSIVNGKAVVKGAVVGSDDGVPLILNGQPVPNPQKPGEPMWLTPPGAKQARADRIGEHMSWQLIDEQEEWEPETDKLLHVLPILGTAFRKVFFDSEKKRNASLYVSPFDLVINYHARSMERAPRITEEVSFYPLEVEAKERSGEFRHVDYGPSPEGFGDDDAPLEFLEQHRWLDLDNDGVREPYIVTVNKSTSEVVRIVARYDLDGIHYNHSKGRIQRIEPIHYYEGYQFLPNFEFKGSIYGTGFGRLLLPLNESINTTLNMLIDAGHLANTQGGFIGKGLSMSSGSMRFRPGEYKMVNASGAAVRDSIVQLQFPGPSPVLFQLLGMLIEAGKEIASVKDVLTGENQNVNTPATTTLAMIEQGLKVFTSIYKRVYRSLKGELKKLYRLNRVYLEEQTSYKIGEEWKQITRADYEQGSGVEPVADPNAVSDMQKLGRAGFLMQFANDPSMNGGKIKRRMLEAAGIDRIDELFNDNPPPNPVFIAKAAELATKQVEAEAGAELKRAQALLARASAINQFAMADKAVGDMHLGFVQQELEAIRVAMEQAASSSPSSVAPPGGSAPPMPAGGLPPHVALPPQPGAAPEQSGNMPASPNTFLAASRQGEIPG